ncbi:MAG: acetate kinase [Deltaproteobacteria bacterium]|nr:acetate kinase [Deltaproteobacteria bacterium]
MALAGADRGTGLSDAVSGSGRRRGAPQTNRDGGARDSRPRIAVINCGSSSIRYQVFDADSGAPLARAVLDNIGAARAGLQLRWRERVAAGSEPGERRELSQTAPIADHREGFAWLLDAARQVEELAPGPGLLGFGHRVVHGGERFRQPTRVDDEVLAAIVALSPLAPLHNPVCALGIEVLRRLVPHLPHVAVFDTAFHQTLPQHAFRYALPDALYREHAVRRYGFHGTSHCYVAGRAAAHLGMPANELRAVSLHLGAGASAAAIDGGASVDTTMGMTPLEGLMMGTRCGDIDPALPFYLARHTRMPLDEIEALLSHRSGLLGVGGSADMREIERRAAAGDAAASLAFEMFCYRVKKTIGAYVAVLGGADALIFTGGIGENSPRVRSRVCQRLGALGIVIDEERNAEVNHDDGRARGAVTGIHRDDSIVRILVIPTDEEAEIARQALATIRH